jgi:hypothetical protein
MSAYLATGLGLTLKQQQIMNGVPFEINVSHEVNVTEETREYFKRLGMHGELIEDNCNKAILYRYGHLFSDVVITESLSVKFAVLGKNFEVVTNDILSSRRAVLKNSLENVILTDYFIDNERSEQLITMIDRIVQRITCKNKKLDGKNGLLNCNKMNIKDMFINHITDIPDCNELAESLVNSVRLNEKTFNDSLRALMTYDDMVRSYVYAIPNNQIADFLPTLSDISEMLVSSSLDPSLLNKCFLEQYCWVVSASENRNLEFCSKLKQQFIESKYFSSFSYENLDLNADFAFLEELKAVKLSNLIQHTIESKWDEKCLIQEVKDDLLYNSL